MYSGRKGLVGKRMLTFLYFTDCYIEHVSVGVVRDVCELQEMLSPWMFH